MTKLTLEDISLSLAISGLARSSDGEDHLIAGELRARRSAQANITTLEQAELKIRPAGIVQDEKVEGKQLLQICGLSIKDPTDSLHKQINRHGFIAGKDFSESFRKSIGGRPGKVYHFTINAANHHMIPVR